MSLRYLAENDRYQVYSIYESTYLKDKKLSKNYSEYDKDDVFMAGSYGDPDSALISFDLEYIAIGGCGITLYYIESGKVVELYGEPDDVTWTEGLYQSEEDESHYIRFVARNKTDLFRVYRLDTKTMNLEEF